MTVITSEILIDLKNFDRETAIALLDQEYDIMLDEIENYYERQNRIPKNDDPLMQTVAPWLNRKPPGPKPTSVVPVTGSE